MDMLSYSKEREPNLERHRPQRRAARRGGAGDRRRRASVGVDAGPQLDAALPLCPADPEGIHRALLNIVGNALDAVEDSADAGVTRVDAPARRTATGCG